MRSTSFYQTNVTGEGTLGIWGTVFAIMSTIVGGGMVSLPWAFLQMGIYLAVGYLLLMALQVLLSSVLFLKAREICPYQPQSMQEIGYVVMGRVSIFWISFVILANSIGLLIIFFSIFGDVASGMMSAIFWPDVLEADANFGMKRPCYVLILSVFLIPFILMKELAELKWVSISLFSAAIMFVIVAVLQLIIRGNQITNEDKLYSDYQFPLPGGAFIFALAAVSTACNFQANIFPIHSNQSDKSMKASMKSITLSMILVGAIYTILSITALFGFGQKIAQSILMNVGAKYEDNQVYWEAYLMQGFFLIILACHIPYLYFSGKESLLVIVDELLRRSTSFTLATKLK